MESTHNLSAVIIPDFNYNSATLEKKKTRQMGQRGFCAFAVGSVSLAFPTVILEGSTLPLFIKWCCITGMLIRHSQSVFFLVKSCSSDHLESICYYGHYTPLFLFIQYVKFCSLYFLLFTASSRRSVSQGAAQKTAREKRKKVRREAPRFSHFFFFRVLFSVLHPDQLNEEAIPFIIMLTVIDDINSAE